MTNDEAIRLLDGIKSQTIHMEYDIYSQRNEAINMAVDALERDKWIPCSERMPEEHDTMFAKIYGTSKWNKYMWKKESDEVDVTVEFENGERRTYHMYTADGIWTGKTFLRNKKIVAWKPKMEPWREGSVKHEV